MVFVVLMFRMFCMHYRSSTNYQIASIIIKRMVHEETLFNSTLFSSFRKNDEFGSIFAVLTNLGFGSLNQE